MSEKEKYDHNEERDDNHQLDRQVDGDGKRQRGQETDNVYEVRDRNKRGVTTTGTMSDSQRVEITVTMMRLTPTTLSPDLHDSRDTATKMLRSNMNT